MIQKEFKDVTVVTIAHRLNTIVTYDRILVLDDGNIKEFDTPKNLLNNKNSQFYKIVIENGEDYYQKLCNMIE